MAKSATDLLVIKEGQRLKYLMRTLSIVFLTLAFGIKAIPATAEKQHYKSNGQTSFYGTYEYETNEENNDNERNSDNAEQANRSTSGKELPSSGTKNYSSSGRAILPRTGDSVNSSYFYAGLIFWTGLIYLIFNTKRKEERTL